MDTISKKTNNDTVNIKSQHGLMEKKKQTKSYLKKTPKWSWETTPRFLWIKEKKGLLSMNAVSVFYNHSKAFELILAFWYQNAKICRKALTNAGILNSCDAISS